MTGMQVFSNPAFGEVRTVEKNGEVLLCGKDVAAALGYVSTANAIATHCKGFTEIMTPTAGGPQMMKYINESDVYRLILSSKLPAAEKFGEWVFDDVLPTIRKYGAYMTPAKAEEILMNPEAIITLATQLRDERQQRIEEQQQRAALEQQIEQDRPKVLFADALAGSDTSILIGELAKLLKQNGMDIGQNRLFERLRCDGYLCERGGQRNMPTQRSMDLKIFEICMRPVTRSDGSRTTAATPKVTPKGQQYFINKYCGDRQRPAAQEITAKN